MGLLLSAETAERASINYDINLGDEIVTRELNAEDIVFRSDMRVELQQACATDEMIAHAARVSTMGDRALQKAVESYGDDFAGLINYLMRDRHGSPFEHNLVTFFVQAPIFVFREHMRHRVASYNEESGRYREMRGIFYVPPRERKLIQVGKASNYELHPGSDEQHDLVVEAYKHTAAFAYAQYQRQLKGGIAREVARGVLPLDLYSSMWVSMNARALMNFLSLRVNDEKSITPTHPQWEIEQVAKQMENEWARLMPITHAAFVENGRVAP